MSTEELLKKKKKSWLGSQAETQETRELTKKTLYQEHSG